jgi:hypothetical protein
VLASQGLLNMADSAIFVLDKQNDVFVIIIVLAFGAMVIHLSFGCYFISASLFSHLFSFFV